MKFRNLKSLNEITKMIKRGITPKYTEDNEINVINQRCIREGRIDLDTVRFHDANKNFQEEKILQDYDVLVNSTGVGTLGRVAQFKKISNKTYTADSHVTIIRPIDEIDKLFFGYAIKNKEKFITSMGEGSTGQTELSRIRLGEEVIINVPEIESQKRIALIMQSLDKKIEVNNKIIENLEAQAQAIFKSWFVDFEPFADGDFVESDLGLIPKGWEVKELEDIFEFKKGRKPKKIKEDFKEGYIPYLIKGVIDGNEKPKFTNENKIVKIEELDSFMLMDGANSGNIYYGYEGALGSTFSFLETKNKKYEDILYWFLKENELIIKNQNTGSAIPHANKDFINNMKIAVPKNISENLVSPILRTYRKKIIHTNKENNKLASIRDTLLPRLMAGEIDLSNINIED